MHNTIPRMGFKDLETHLKRSLNQKKMEEDKVPHLELVEQERMSEEMMHNDRIFSRMGSNSCLWGEEEDDEDGSWIRVT